MSLEFLGTSCQTLIYDPWNGFWREARMLKDVLIREGLSNRESEVAELVTQGLSNKEVASRLFVTEKTVKFHLTNIYKKMNVKSRAQLIVWCLPNMSFVERSGDSATSQNSNHGSHNGGHNSGPAKAAEPPQIIPGQANKIEYKF